MANDNSGNKLIDLDEVVATKFKGKKLPGFVMRFLKRFVHQDWLNDGLSRCRDGAEFYGDALKELDVKIVVEGAERVPKDGTRYVFVYNPNGTVRYVEVKLGQRLGDRYEILSGLSSGDRVVIAGQSRLTAGTKVQLQEQQSAKK